MAFWGYIQRFYCFHLCIKIEYMQNKNSLKPPVNKENAKKVSNNVNIFSKKY